MLTEFHRRMNEHSKNFRDRKYKKVPNRSHRAKEYSNLTNDNTKIQEGFNNRLDNAEERTSQLIYRAMELTQLEHLNEKKNPEGSLRKL